MVVVVEDRRCFGSRLVSAKVTKPGALLVVGGRLVVVGRRLLNYRSSGWVSATGWCHQFWTLDDLFQRRKIGVSVVSAADLLKSRACGCGNEPGVGLGPV